MKPPRIPTVLASLTINIPRLFIILILFLIASTSLPVILTFDSAADFTEATGRRLQDIPGLTHILGPTSHTPPSSPNTDSSSTADPPPQKWYSSWTAWLDPFSSSSDSNSEGLNVALPVLQERCPVYTYYDPKDEFDKDIDEKGLLVWRRAWWAMGFKPVILTVGDALENKWAEIVQIQVLRTERLKYEMMRFMAWGHMGGGVFADYRTIPIAPYNDIGLSALRRCDTPYLTRFSSQEGMIYASPSGAIQSLLTFLIDPKQYNANYNTTSLEEATKDDPNRNLWQIEPELTSLAIYSSKQVNALYKDITPGNLSVLINAHLHGFFLQQFSEGIDILQPYPDLTRDLMRETHSLAQRLTTCPVSPIKDSCPPNIKHCKQCISSSTPPVRTISSLAKLEIDNDKETKKENTGSNNDKDDIVTFVSPVLPKEKYTLANILHPYITLSLLTFNDTNLKSILDHLDENFIRRYTKSDAWILAATESLFEPLFPAENRTVTIKRAIAGPKNFGRGLFATSEVPWDTHEIEWSLGFSLPSEEKKDTTGKQLEEGEVGKFVDKAHKFLIKNLKSRLFSGGGEKVVKAVEEWSKYDAEVWRFTRAMMERGEGERRKWEEEEKKFVGKGWGEGTGHEWGFGWL